MRVLRYFLKMGVIVLVFVWLQEKLEDQVEDEGDIYHTAVNRHSATVE